MYFSVHKTTTVNSKSWMYRRKADVERRETRLMASNTDYKKLFRYYRSRMLNADD